MISRSRAGAGQRSGRTPHPAVVDSVFRALSDPTRRDVLERLTTRPASTSELAAPYDMALPSFMEHLRLLEGSGLIRSRKDGRTRTYELAPERMKVAEGWLDRQRRLWERRFDQLDSYLMKLKQEESK
jgi:DNA-binding transcriptional ArsR family regulator